MSLILLIRSNVSLALLNGSLIAVGHALHAPAGQVFGRRIEGQHLVQDAVVQRFLDKPLDLAEINHHTVTVKLLRTAVNHNHPVMTVYAGTLALIVQLQTMTSRDFYFLLYVIHIPIISSHHFPTS